MKRVLLHGYTMDNLGDDLFFRVLVSRYPDMQFVLPTLNCSYRKKFSDLKNLCVVDFCRVARITTRKVYMLPKLYSRLFIKSFDAVVCIGGSLFIDRKNPSVKDRIETENYSFIYDWEIARKANVPYYLLGANWGPCYNSYFFEYFNRAFDFLEDICFRDRYSYEIFKSKPRARCGGDILMGSPFIRDAVPPCGKKKQIVFSVIDVAFKCETETDAEVYIAKMVELCREFVKLGYRVKLLSFCSWEGDEATAEKIQVGAGIGAGIEILRYHNNWREMLTAIAESEVIVSARFHGTVLGWTLNSRVFSLLYSHKTLNMIQDCGINGGYAWLHDIGKLTAGHILEHAVELRSPGTFGGEGAAFAKLDQALKN